MLILYIYIFSVSTHYVLVFRVSKHVKTKSISLAPFCVHRTLSLSTLTHSYYWHSNKCHSHFSTHQQHLTQSIILFHSDTLPPLALGPLTLLTFPLLTSCSFWISFTSFHSISLPNNAVTLGLDHVSQPTLTCQEVIQPKVLPPRCQCLPNSHHQPSLSHRLQIHAFDLLFVISTWLSNEHFNSYVSKTDLLKKQTNKKKTELLSH